MDAKRIVWATGLLGVALLCGAPWRAVAESPAEQDTIGTIVMMEPVDVEHATEATAVRRDTSAVEEHHPQDSPEDRGFLILTSDGESSLRIRGSIRVNGGYDFGGLQQVAKFSTYDIPVGEDNTSEPRFFMQANQTRMSLEAIRATRLGQAFMRIEGDFLGEPDNFRLRHAFGSLNFLLAGLTWSTFGDVESLPLTVDLDGPNSSVAERTVQIRYGKGFADHWTWNVAIESPTPELRLPQNVEPAFQRFPDLISRVKISRDRAGTRRHLQSGDRVLRLDEIHRRFCVDQASLEPPNGFVLQGGPDPAGEPRVSTH